MNLYHFYDVRTGPFKSLTKIPAEEAKAVIGRIREERPDSMCAQRNDTYVEKRRNCEAILRREFEKKGGVMEISSPHYMVVEFSPWLYSWYEQPAFIKIPIEEFDLKTVSFTYGDSMPTFSDKVNDGKEYRKKLYTCDEILKVIDKYGLPQEWNDDGSKGPERYIEAHVWSDRVIEKYC
ncbi:hypothetical protein [Butyrivibrio sp. AE2032]|uniref:hypothetical protein n=1 Tax=Butyrivibrio sp. AE2032 TaxID=1458463 RepID=UPI000551DC46|nr:hypothetical protein [Butyrivibrio sp. AE2032]